MRMTYLMLISTFCFGIIGLVLWTDSAYAKPPGCSPVAHNLAACNQNLDACMDDLDTCQATFQIFPGDGYDNPDDYGVSGHGPELSYTDNGDGTFTDNNTKLMWEEKDNSGGIHDVNNTYTWSSSGTAADGTLFNGTNTIGTDFLYTLNNTCAGDETMYCTNDTDCTGIGNGKCGFAGHQDWRIPNVKELQSLVNYINEYPAWSAPGYCDDSAYWSATSAATGATAWYVDFSTGKVDDDILKPGSNHARAVRP